MMKPDYLSASEACEEVRRCLTVLRQTAEHTPSLNKHLSAFALTDPMMFGAETHSDFSSRQRLCDVMVKRWRHSPASTATFTVAHTKEAVVMLDFWIHSRKRGYVVEGVFRGRPKQAFILACGTKHAKEEEYRVTKIDTLISSLAYRIQRTDEFLP